VREQFGADAGEPVDERFQMSDRADVVRQEVARLLAQRLDDVDEILDVQTALFRLQSGEVCRRDGDSSRHVGLAAAFGFAKLPEDAAVHTFIRLHVRGQIVNGETENCQAGKGFRAGSGAKYSLRFRGHGCSAAGRCDDDT